MHTNIKYGECFECGYIQALPKDWDYEYCCNGWECGCMGDPLNPPFCLKCIENGNAPYEISYPDMAYLKSEMTYEQIEALKDTLKSKEVDIHIKYIYKHLLDNPLEALPIMDEYILVEEGRFYNNRY